MQCRLTDGDGADGIFDWISSIVLFIQRKIGVYNLINIFVFTYLVI